MGNKMEMNEHEMDEPMEHDEDHEVIMGQVAKELMDAIEKKDKEQLLECFQVLVADIMDKMTDKES